MTDEPERLDAPNQQVVRPDASHPADEGTGGSTGKPKKGGAKAADKPSAGKPATKAGTPSDPPDTADKG